MAVNTANLGSFVLTRKVVSSTILTATPTNIMQVVGDCLLDSITVTTDATGLAGGTNFSIIANGVTVFTETVANLGANKSTNSSRATVLGVKAFVPANSFISVQNSAANGTGAGVITVCAEFKKLDNVSGGNTI